MSTSKNGRPKGMPDATAYSFALHARPLDVAVLLASAVRAVDRLEAGDPAGAVAGELDAAVWLFATAVQNRLAAVLEGGAV